MADTVWNYNNGKANYGDFNMPQSDFANLSPNARVGYENAYNSGGGGQQSGGMFGGVFDGIGDTVTAGPNGGQQTSQGWGGTVLGLGSMYLNYTQGKAQQDMAREQLDFSKEQFYKNYAMQMDKYRRGVNRESAGLAHAGSNGAWSDTFGRFNDGSAMLDENGNTQADPIYGAVQASAFAPAVNAPAVPGQAQAAPASAFSPVGSMDMNNMNNMNPMGTGVEGVLPTEAAKRKARPASARTSNSEQMSNENSAVEASTTDTKKKRKIT